MRARWWLVWLWLGWMGCGDGSAPGSFRVGTGGAGGSEGLFGSGCLCPVGEECAPDGRCVSICGDVAACVSGDTAVCCPVGRACQAGACVAGCGDAVECGGQCCESEQVCLDGACAAACSDPSLLCGAQSELCCAVDETCLGDTCVPVSNECTVGEDCEIDELCEPSQGVCIPRSSVEVCEFRPPVGEFSPTIGCRWTPPEAAPGASSDELAIAEMAEVVMTPAVANLTDDNGDGKTDTFDTPDIVFVSFDYSANGCCTSRGVLRIVSGACNPDGSMDTLATLRGLGTGDWIGNSTGIALGNLHSDDEPGERVPEIVATFKNGGTVAWRRTADDGSAWEVMWQNDDLPTNMHTRGGAQPSIADLNADGRPEVIVGNVVLDGATGMGPGDAGLPPGALAWD